MTKFTKATQIFDTKPNFEVVRMLAEYKAQPAFFYSNGTPCNQKYVMQKGKLYVFTAKTKWVGGGYMTIGHTKRRLYGKAAAEKLVARTEKARAKREAEQKAAFEAKRAASFAKHNANLTDDDKVIIAKAKLVSGLQSDVPHLRRSIATLADMVNRGEGWGFTPKMVAAMDKIATQVGAGMTEQNKVEKAAKDSSQWIQDGRYEITGEIVTIKEQVGHYGTTVKMLLKSGLHKYWMTYPRGLDAEKGETVTIKGTVERSQKDPMFGIVKRPAVVK